MNEKLKKLTGKNPADFKPVAFDTVNMPDVELFCQLVQSEDYLFDFVKRNVSDRLAKECNSSNYLNLLKFLKFYSPSYEEFIVSSLVRYADEDLTDKMLEIFENGTEDEKTYCAKFFSYIQDPLALEFLKEYAYSENGYLSSNCASVLALFGDKESYNDALEKLKSSDEFERLDGVKFLVSYGNKDAVPYIYDAIITSHLAENMAGELPYLVDLSEWLNRNNSCALYVINLIVNGLGEILCPSVVLDFNLYEVFKNILALPENGKPAVVLLNAADKFDILTENDEYLYDESKEVKQEVYAIKELLSEVKKLKESKYVPLVDGQLYADDIFVYTALEYSINYDRMRELLTSSNQTVILKVIEVLKRSNQLTPKDKGIALEHVSNSDIKNIIEAI